MPRKKISTLHRQDSRPVVTLESLYTELNGELFGDRLHRVDEIRLEWKAPAEMKKALGDITMRWQFSATKRPLLGSVRIRVRTGMTDRQTRKTVAHEMAHLAAAMEDGTLKHNRTFWRVMETIGYGKHHRFEGADTNERDLYTCKSEERKAVWFWRKQPVGVAVRYNGWPGYMLAEVQKRGTKVRITNGRGFYWWVSATSVKPL